MSKREGHDAVRAEEEARLAETLGLVRAALGEAEALHGRIEDGYREAKRYQVAYRGEIDPAEAFQNELALAEVDRRAAQSHEAAAQLRKMLDAPYFARVDFAADGEGEPEAFYLWRFSFAAEGRTVVSDWRSPVAALFYEHDETGPAAYEAPSGRVEGFLSRKRQLGVERGELVYAADSASSVRDEVLARELGRDSDRKMRAIVASIQAEQNRIIRDEEPGTLVIQGVAGSGKTSIALHRVAYLLYRRRGELSSRHVALSSRRTACSPTTSPACCRSSARSPSRRSTCAESWSGRSAAPCASRPRARVLTRWTRRGASAPA